MATENLDEIHRLLDKCEPEERAALFKHLRASHQIHELEASLGASAEIILEAIHSAPEMTIRMLRGVIADAAFAKTIVPRLAPEHWQNVTPVGNFAYDHPLQDPTGQVSVQVKLQRSEKGQPVVTNGRKAKLAAGHYVVETQKSRTGTRKVAGEADEAVAAKTRPYRYGEFDVLAVSMWPSTKRWDSFMYTVGNWLLPGDDPTEIKTLQPVPMAPNEDWTDDFRVVAAWHRQNIQKRISNKTDQIALLDI